MQNSLQRLLEGLAVSLREQIAPAVADPYARAQVAAAAELVENLGTRVEWRSQWLLEEVERVRPVLEAAVAGADAADLPLAREVLVGPSEGNPLEARNRHVAALAEVAAWAEGREVEADVRRVLAEQLATEALLMRRGMYRDGRMDEADTSL
jgi:hypothetical protein